MSTQRLPKIHASIIVSATPDAVWDVLVDPVYIPKLHQDILFMNVTPEGKAVKGQLRTAVAKAGRTKITIYGEVTCAEKPVRFTFQQRPGGLFKVYVEDFELLKVSLGTEVKANFSYELSQEYLHGALNVAMLENGIANSLGSFLKNLKDIAELKPLQPHLEASRGEKHSS